MDGSLKLCSCFVVLVLNAHVAMGTSARKLGVGVLWETDIINDIVHLNRSLELMTQLTNDTRLEIYNVTGLNLMQVEQLVCTAGSNGIFTFLIALGCYQSAVLSSISIKQDISVIAIDSGCHYADNPPSYFTFKSEPASVARVIADIVAHQNWASFAVLYDDASGDDFDEIMDVVDEANSTIRAFKIHVDTNLDSTLKTLVETLPGPRRIVLLCDIGCQVKVMQRVNHYDKVNMVQAQFQFQDQWLLVAERFELSKLEEEVGKVDNIVVLIPKSLREKSIESRIEEAFSYILQSVPQVYYQAMPGQSQSILPSSCPNASRSGLASFGFEMYVDGLRCLDCEGYEVVTLMYGTSKRYSDTVASWSDSGLTVQHQLFPNLNYGMNGRDFLVSTNVWDPFVINTTTSSRPSFEGLCIELLKELARTANFTYRLTWPPDGAWGGVHNGSWTGLVGQLQRKEIDMTVAPLSIQPIRQPVMDFTDPYFNEYLTVLAKLPDADEAKWSLYISPFKWQVWLSIAGSIPIVGFIVWVVTCITPYYGYFGEDTGLSRLDNSVFYMFGALFTQGGIHLPNAQSGRFVVGFWWMYCIVLVATYSGNLIAFLTVSISQLPFNTLEQVVDQDGIKYGMMGETASYNEFMESHDQVIAQAWSQVLEFAKEDPDIFSTDHSIHLNKVLEGGYAYINDRTGFEVEMSKHCQIQMIRETFVATPYAVGLQKGSAYVKTFTAGVRKVIEGGLINKWKARWWPRQSFCSRGLVTEAKSVTLQDVQGAYYVMGILLLMAFLSLAIETFLHFICRKEAEVDDSKAAQTAEPAMTAEELRDIAIWGTSRQENCNPPDALGIRDIYANKEPMVDMFGRSS